MRLDGRDYLKIYLKRDAEKTSWRFIILKEKSAEHNCFNACIAGNQLAEDQPDFSITLVDGESWEYLGQFTSILAKISRIDRETNPNHWHNFVDDEIPRKSPDIGPPKTEIGIEDDEQERRKVKTTLKQEQVANLLHSYGVKDPLMVHGSQIIPSR